MTFFANILIPLPLTRPIFTYKIDGIEEDSGETWVGKLAVVPFGKGKTYTGLIMEVSPTPFTDKAIRYKRVSQILPYPPLPTSIQKLWKWAADYYMCSLGDILTAAIPASFRPDGKQDEALTKPARTIKGWVPSKKFMESEHWQSSLFVEMQRRPAVTKAMNRLLQDYKADEQLPMTLSDMAKWLDVGVATVNQLREKYIIEEVTVIAPEEQEPISLSTKSEDTISRRIRFGSQGILLLQVENSSVIERIPFDFIQQIVEEGRGVLLLFPTLEKLQKRLPLLKETFGALLYPYYSENRAKENEAAWLAALEGKAGLYVGLRAATWLPFDNLGAVIVLDEEDKGYRQFEPAPRFTATQLAIMLGHLSKAKVILISPTPSIESYMNALQKKFAFVQAAKSPKEIDIQTVCMPTAFEKQRVQGRMLSFELMGAIREALEEQGLALLIYQRKGFAKRATCKECGESPKCPRCGTIYRYFQESHHLVCGMCGHYEPMPKNCPECQKPTLILEGTGIERIRQALYQLYPGATICMEDELKQEKSKPQIILSTAYEAPFSLLQKATTIGILQLDLLTTFPDFRANERAFQYLVQCRDEAPMLKRMVIQYLVEQQNALDAFMENDYRVMLDKELEDRHALLFPPFSRSIDIYFESAVQNEAFNLASLALNQLNQSLADCSPMGPAPLPIHKKDRAIGYKVTLLSPLSRSSKELRDTIYQIINPIISQYRGPQMYVYYDVDPL